MSRYKLFDIQSNTLNAKKGKVLVAEPFFNDIFFGRSVILLADHDDKAGSFGVIMNKKLGVTLEEAAPEFTNCDFPLYLGGPVLTKNIFFIHSLGMLIPESTQICDGLYWGGDPDFVKKMVTENRISRNEIRFFLGYSGWDKMQLRSELRRNSWIVVNADSIALLHSNPMKMWDFFVRKAGERYNIWTRYPDDPHKN